MFRRRHGALALVLLLVIVAGGCGPSTNPDTVCDSAGCISLSKFSANITTTLQGKVVGFISFVGTLPVVFSGQARTSVDPPSMSMLPDLPTNIASLSKVLTTIGVLQSLGAHGLSIDFLISPYLWPNWKQGPGVNTITFRQLLTHTSGFLNDASTYAQLAQQVSQGITLTTPAPRSYNNLNFALFREMLPFMEGNSYNPLFDGAPDVWSANFYVNYMNQHVFARLGMTYRQCKAVEPNVILSYPGTPAPTPSPRGTDWGDDTLGCGAGGWVLSAGDLYKIVDDLANGNLLLSNYEKGLMNSSCLGWDQCPLFSGSDYFAKNGAYPLGGSTTVFPLNTYFGIIKCNVPVVVITNSAIPGDTTNIIDVVGNAYKNAAVTGTAVPCPILPAQQAPPRVQFVNTARPPTPLPLPAQTRPPVQPQLTAAPTRAPTARDSQAPRPPVLVGPIDGAALDCGRVSLTWKSAADASGIRDVEVELEKLADRTYVAERTWNSTRGESVSFEAACDTHYRWRIRATGNAGNQGGWSGYQDFHVRPMLQ